VAPPPCRLLHRLVLRVPLVGVQRVVVHGDHAEQVVVVLGDRLARPVPVDVTDHEVLQVPPEGPVDRCHGDTLESPGPDGQIVVPGGMIRAPLLQERTMTAEMTDIERPRRRAHRAAASLLTLTVLTAGAAACAQEADNGSITMEPVDNGTHDGGSSTGGGANFQATTEFLK